MNAVERLNEKYADKLDDDNEWIGTEEEYWEYFSLAFTAAMSSK
jgi:hypothetical protein